MFFLRKTYIKASGAHRKHHRTSPINSNQPHHSHTPHCCCCTTLPHRRLSLFSFVSPLLIIHVTIVAIGVLLKYCLCRARITDCLPKNTDDNTRRIFDRLINRPSLINCDPSSIILLRRRDCLDVFNPLTIF
jgi:hypothetical protein